MSWKYKHGTVTKSDVQVLPKLHKPILPDDFYVIKDQKLILTNIQILRLSFAIGLQVLFFLLHSRKNFLFTGINLNMDPGSEVGAI